MKSSPSRSIRVKCSGEVSADMSAVMMSMVEAAAFAGVTVEAAFEGAFSVRGCTRAAWEPPRSGHPHVSFAAQDGGASNPAKGAGLYVCAAP